MDSSSTKTFPPKILFEKKPVKDARMERIKKLSKSEKAAHRYERIEKCMRAIMFR